MAAAVEGPSLGFTSPQGAAAPAGIPPRGASADYGDATLIPNLIYEVIISSCLWVGCFRPRSIYFIYLENIVMNS
jgi:hypothetical protein